MRKALTLLLTAILVLSSLFMVGSVCAQSVPKPSVPEFTLEYTDNSYDVPPQQISSTDPYTNKKTTRTIPGYHVKNQTIELTIENQPYPPYIGGNKTFLTYVVQTKPHFSEDWKNATRTSVIPSDGAGFTVISLPVDYRVGDYVDFRVQAILEYEYTISRWTRLPPLGFSMGLYPYNITDVYDTSDWSPINTFIIPDSSTVFPQSLIIASAVVVAVVLVGLGLLLYLIKRK